MDKKKDLHSKPKSDRERNSRLLDFLGRLGLKGIKGKHSIGITAGGCIKHYCLWGDLPWRERGSGIK